MDLHELKQVITEISSSYTKDTDVKYLKKYGQYFTINEVILNSLLNDYETNEHGKT
jgi:hypothetical protein